MHSEDVHAASESESVITVRPNGLKEVTFPRDMILRGIYRDEVLHSARIGAPLPDEPIAL